jgi:beta-lactamase regulating signal transducer with metallopeptidase domain
MSALAWLAAYLMHSTIALGAMWLLRRRVRHEASLETLWRAAVIGPIVTSTIVAAGAGAPWRLDWPNWTIPPAFLSSTAQTLDEPASVLWIVVTGCVFTGAARFLLDLIRRVVFLRGLGREAVEGAALAELRDLAGISPLAHAVRLTGSATLASPIAIGRREICLPLRALNDLSRRELRACLAHELAHMERRDEQWCYLLAAVDRLLWMQPLNRVARRELELLAESACDDWAADRLSDREGVAECLVSIATWPRTSVPLGVHRAGAGSLVRRGERLVAEGVSRDELSATTVRAAVIAGALVLWSVPGIEPSMGSRDYWIGFELGRQYRAEHPGASHDASGRSLDARARADLERRLIDRTRTAVGAQPLSTSPQMRSDRVR